MLLLRLTIGGLIALAAPGGLAVQAEAHSTEVPSERAARNLADFDFAVDRISANYAGWHTKITDEARPRLDALTARLRASAAEANDEQLFAILSEWIAFFDDRHVSIRRQPRPTPTTAGEIDYPTLPWTEESVRARLRELGSARQPVEGIWRISGGHYRVGVLRTGEGGSRLAAVVLTTRAENWRPGQVKADLVLGEDGQFEMIFRPSDHSEVPATASLALEEKVLAVPNWGAWEREWPDPVEPSLVARIFPATELFLRRLSNNTLWLRIPDFADSRAASLRDLLDQHRAELEQTPNLIIDLRNNGGGSDYVYEPVAELLYTRPVISIGVEMRATTDNIALRQQVADRIRAGAPEQAAAIEALNARLSTRIGNYVLQEERPFDIERRDAVLPFPSRVAVLIDNAASTGEQFLLLARQSRKATLFGQRNSAGVLDFANVVGMPTPSGRFLLQWATSRSLRLPDDPVDPHGIAPDIRIPDEVSDPVGYALGWLERQVD